MKHRQLFATGNILVLFILLAAACTSTTNPPKITVTFPTDGKCSMEGPTTIPAGKDVTLEVVTNELLGIAILRLDPDKTIKDLEELSSDETQPDWSLRVGFYDFPADGSANSIVLNQSVGPIYFLCMTKSDLAGALGPIEVK